MYRALDLDLDFSPLPRGGGGGVVAATSTDNGRHIVILP